MHRHWAFVPKHVVWSHFETITVALQTQGVDPDKIGILLKCESFVNSRQNWKGRLSFWIGRFWTVWIKWSFLENTKKLRVFSKSKTGINLSNYQVIKFLSRPFCSCRKRILTSRVTFARNRSKEVTSLAIQRISTQGITKVSLKTFFVWHLNIFSLEPILSVIIQQTFTRIDFFGSVKINSRFSIDCSDQRLYIWGRTVVHQYCPVRGDDWAQVKVSNFENGVSFLDEICIFQRYQICSVLSQKGFIGIFWVAIMFAYLPQTRFYWFKKESLIGGRYVLVPYWCESPEFSMKLISFTF